MASHTRPTVWALGKNQRVLSPFPTALSPPCMRERGYIVDKLLAFHTEHDTPWPETLRDLEHAIDQIPRKYHADEAKPLLDRQREALRSRKKGPQPLSQILAVVLARLGVGAVSSTPSGEKDLT
jgi:hypothetical protein